MGYTLDEFSTEARRILAANPGPEGRKKVCELVSRACTDADFVAKYLPDNAPDRKILYEDPELGFCILGHVYHGAKQSAPHDHGPTWAIYGQAQGETLMTDWALVSPASDEQPGKVRHVRDYKLTPGAAYVYNEGDLHSPRRNGSTKLIRIEGRNVEKIRRFPYEAV
jgi:predicted metal-dependent enzyme (double-stranded beta helix superfamily)